MRARRIRQLISLFAWLTVRRLPGREAGGGR